MTAIFFIFEGTFLIRTVVLALNLNS